MKISFSATHGQHETALVIPVFSGNVVRDAVGVQMQNFIAEALKQEPDFKGKSGQTLTLRGSGSVQRVILLGMGDKKDLDAASVRKLGAPLYRALEVEGVKAATVDAYSLTPKLAAQLADGLLFQSYEFRKYKTVRPESPKPQDIRVMTPDVKKTSAAFDALRTTTDSVFWASDLCNEPGNVLNPVTYAERIKAELEPLGIKVKVLEVKDMQALGMGAALAVGQGSETPPCMVVMEYDGSQGKQKRPLALVGKGITFDSGGISLKPGAGMGDMTLDMGGSAAVVGAMRSLAAREAKAKVVAIVALAENMPDSKSYRPGDILTSMSGKTIDVGNTDAEGRLVLCDAMTYIQRTFDPHTVVDLATLTGAAIGALGHEFSAVYSNDNSLSKKFNAASVASGEKIWHMPLTETTKFAETMKSTPYADLTNIGGKAGSCTAAAFLREFIEKDDTGADSCKWMHIDMAGPGIPPGQVKKGWGVLLLDQFVRDHAEVTAPKAKKAPARKTVKTAMARKR